MAQTKGKPKSKSTKRPKSASSKSKASKSTKSAKPKAKSRSSSSKPRSSSNGASRSNGSSGKSTPVEAVRGAVGDVGDKAKGAGKTVGKAASKAKVPLMAGGAAIAGAAGGLALASSKQARKSKLSKAMTRRPKVKIKSGDIAKAAKEVGNFGAQVGQLADEMQRARESGNGRHRSPVEVVLQGLTARR